MTGNSDFAKWIELGTKAQMTYDCIITDKEGKEHPITFEWRALYEWENSDVLSDSFAKIPQDAIRWLIAKPEQREEMRSNGFTIPSSHIKSFDHWLAVNTIYHATKDFYPDSTVEQVAKFNINFDEFHDIIAKAGGTKDGQKTVASFPDNEGAQVSEGETEQRSRAQSSG